jgi:hypothetical protein
MEATTTNQGDNKMNTTTHGTAYGVNWTKYATTTLIHGFTAIIVDGKQVAFHGHTSNARAWNYIEKTLKKRGVKVINGEIVTKASK